MKAQDSRVLLTGATGGIGKATARALLAAGASVMLVGRSVPALESFHRELTGEGISPSRLKWVPADLTRHDDITRLASESARLGCNVVIHNAGLPSFGPLAEHSPDEMAAVLQTNLLAPMLLTQALLPHLQTLPAARILFVGSALGSIGLPGYSVYSASKFGVHGFAQALRRELSGSSVKVQYIGPRSTDTGFNSAAVQAYNRATGTAQDSPEVVAGAIVQMLEDEAVERVLGFPEKLAARLNGLAPEWLDGSFRRHRQSLQNHAATTRVART